MLNAFQYPIQTPPSGSSDEKPEPGTSEEKISGGNVGESKHPLSDSISKDFIGTEEKRSPVTSPIRPLTNTSWESNTSGEASSIVSAACDRIADVTTAKPEGCQNEGNDNIDILTNEENSELKGYEVPPMMKKGAINPEKDSSDCVKLDTPPVDNGTPLSAGAHIPRSAVSFISPPGSNDTCHRGSLTPAVNRSNTNRQVVSGSNGKNRFISTISPGINSLEYSGTSSLSSVGWKNNQENTLVGDHSPAAVFSKAEFESILNSGDSHSPGDSGSHSLQNQSSPIAVSHSRNITPSSESVSGLTNSRVDKFHESIITMPPVTKSKSISMSIVLKYIAFCAVAIFLMIPCIFHGGKFFFSGNLKEPMLSAICRYDPGICSNSILPIYKNDFKIETCDINDPTSFCHPSSSDIDAASPVVGLEGEPLAEVN